MKSIHFLITTCDRPNELQNLLCDINEQREGFEIEATILEDGKSYNWDKISVNVHHGYMAGLYQQSHNGKKGYWKTINNLWEKSKSDNISTTPDYYIQLPDDARLLPGSLKEIVRQFELLPKDAICLNLLLDKSRVGRPNWTIQYPTIERHGDTNFFRTHWVDMCFIARREFFEALDWRINPVDPRRWDKNPEYGSGVGLDITTRLKGRKMYQVRYPVLDNVGFGASKMNPGVSDPNNQEFRLDPLIGGMATMPGREDILERAVESVLPQVDRLFIYYNGKKQPQILKELYKKWGDKLAYWIANDKKQLPGTSFTGTYCDMGDSGKFYGPLCIEPFEMPAPHNIFTFDDDLIYPKDHVWRLYHGMERLKSITGKPWIVGIHGRRIPPKKVKSYYGIGATFHWKKAVTKAAMKVNCLGTGTTGFHSDTIKLSMDDFPLTHMNMADIHLGIAAQKQGVPMAVVAHAANYFAMLSTKRGTTIYEKHHRRDHLQTERVNSIDWRLI